MEFDTIYKFVAATFALAYFIGLITGIISVGLGSTNFQEADIAKSFYLTGPISFKLLFNETIDTCLKISILPFSYLIVGINYGFTHAIHILSPFLGQIKLAVLLIPEMFYFLSYILFSAIGLKLIATIVLFIVNNWILKEKKIKLEQTILRKEDVFLIYLGLISIFLGTIIQIYLSKVFFIFLINFQLITYILIVLIYVTIISLSFYILYNTIQSLIKIFNKSEKL